MSSRATRAGVVVLVLLLLLAGITRWRMGTTIVVIGDTGYLSEPVPPNAATEISVFAYNVQARPWFDDSDHKFPFIAPRLNHYDIVAVQECFKDHALLWEGTEHPVRVYHGGLRHPAKLVGSGLSTLARFPLEHERTFHYSRGGNFENRIASKGILLTRLRIHGRPLDVYNTHMVAAKTPSSMEARRGQARELIDFVNANTPADDALLLLGDFNMRHSRGDGQHPEIVAGTVPARFDTLSQPQLFDAILLALRLQDAGEVLNGPAFDGVDHVLYRSGARWTITPRHAIRDASEFRDPEGVPLSDHAPLMVRFRLAPGSGQRQ